MVRERGRAGVDADEGEDVTDELDKGEWEKEGAGAKEGAGEGAGEGAKDEKWLGEEGEGAKECPLKS